MKHTHSILGLCCIMALLTGCATTAPVQEVRQVSAAYDAALAAGEPLLDELAIAERRGVVKAKMAEASPFTTDDGLTVFLTFKVSMAASLASIGDPPSTARQRRGLKVVGSYIDVLEILAEGRNIEEAKSRVRTLGMNLAALAAVATGGAGAAVQPLLAAFDPILDGVARTQNVQELRELVLRGEKPIDTLLDDLMTSSEDIYTVLIDEAMNAAMDTHSQNKAAQRADVLKIAGYQVAVGNYVVLLQQVRATLSTLAEAVRAPSRATLTAMAASTSELLVQAQAVRRAYAVIRNPATTGAVLEVTR